MKNREIFQPIENYGVIGNMRSIALVGTNGSIDFLCFPGFDSPTVFAGLLDAERGGQFSIQPQMEEMRTRQLYLPDTNVLLTRFLSDDGVAEVTDFMPIVEDGDLQRFGHHILRMISVTKGEVRFTMRCAPRFDYSRAKHKATHKDGSIFFAPEAEECLCMALHATFPMKIEGGDAKAEFTLKAGETATVVFGEVAEEQAAGADVLAKENVQRHFSETTNFWRAWIAKSRYTGRWREVVHRSILMLKLLSCEEYGSLIAAPTFGLPEHVGGERNWDYRYTWLRDASFSLYAFIRLGFVDEAEAFTRWIRERMHDDAQRGPLQIMYRPNGEKDLEEKILDSLCGYKNSRPVRIGNGAYQQLQLDVYGEFMDAVYLSNKYGDGISNDEWISLQRILEWLAGNWERPDEGIWEVRGGQREFLHSRLMSWVAFDRAVRLADKRSLAGPVEKWREIRDAIHDDIYESFWNEKLQCFVQSKGADVVDASVLLMPLMRFISPVDPRWLSTMKAVEENLVEDSLVYRYNNAAAPIDGLQGAEGSFTACSFWYIECLARAHQTEKAQLLFDKMLGYANHLGLYAEELGSGGEHLGNFPQAFTHLALISAATFLDRELDGKNKAPWR
ncbi:MAG TPA: glycoside hydrolase family 15 protein [Acidobacteriaceae bacterium]|nr:glycoside hydrolase family 15 protein [Acidobacteriaceae bacterium]